MASSQPHGWGWGDEYAGFSNEMVEIIVYEILYISPKNPHPNPSHIRWRLLCFPMKSHRFFMFLRAAHASLPVPSARSAELHCRVDVSGCEWLYFYEKSRPLRQGLVFRLFPVSIWNWIHSFIHPISISIRNPFFINLINLIGDLQELWELFIFTRFLKVFGYW